MNHSNRYEARKASDKFIFFGIVVLILFCESVLTLASSIQRGILKKEILDRNSGLGFDFNIIVKN